MGEGIVGVQAANRKANRQATLEINRDVMRESRPNWFVLEESRC